jgi:hypothetical protein
MAHNGTHGPEHPDAQGLPVVTPRMVARGPLGRIADALSLPHSPSGFAPAAEDQYMAIIDQVEGDIAVEAITRARKRNATVVDLADVNAAHKQVVGRDAQLKAWWIGLAGVLLGPQSRLR